MRYYFAPMEGITDQTYRRVHHQFFPGCDKYFTPFLSPSKNHWFTNRELREIAVENNKGIPLVPQILTANATDFLWAVHALAEIGYREVNFNLGCPSGTVTAKGKGCGLLAVPEKLDRFFDQVFPALPVALSVKTRLGIDTPEEFTDLLRIYNRYPIHELTIHSRTQKELYASPVHLDTFAWAMAHSQIPLCYNGSLSSVTDCDSLSKQIPSLQALMIGRGFITDPALICRLQGKPAADRDTLHLFHDTLVAEYQIAFGSHGNILPRMKEIWSFMIHCFASSERYQKRIKRATKWPDFAAVIDTVFAELALLPDA